MRGMLIRLWERIRDRVDRVVYGPPTPLQIHARRELDLWLARTSADGLEMERAICADVMDLVRVMTRQGHSGTTAPYMLRLFEKVSSWNVLTPLTGQADEWRDESKIFGSPHWQNVRKTSVFKNEHGDVYDTDGIVFVEPDGFSFRSPDSSVPVTFPYLPSLKIVKVDESGVPLSELASAPLTAGAVAELH